MTQLHPEIADEQQFVDHAYECEAAERSVNARHAWVDLGHFRRVLTQRC